MQAERKTLSTLFSLFSRPPNTVDLKIDQVDARGRRTTEVLGLSLNQARDLVPELLTVKLAASAQPVSTFLRTRLTINLRRVVCPPEQQDVDIVSEFLGGIVLTCLDHPTFWNSATAVKMTFQVSSDWVRDVVRAAIAGSTQEDRKMRCRVAQG